MKQRKPELRQHPDHSLVPADDNDNDGQNEDLSSRPRPAQEFPAAQKFLAFPASVSVTPLAGGSWGPRDPPDAPGSLCRHWVHMDARGPEAPGGDALRDAVSGDPPPASASLLALRVLERGLGGGMRAAGAQLRAGSCTPYPKVPEKRAPCPAGKQPPGAAGHPPAGREQTSSDRAATRKGWSLWQVV